VLDFRDSDTVTRFRGAETKEYTFREKADAKNARFDHVHELERVADFDSVLFSSVRPFITVHSGRRGVDVASAKSWLRAVLAARSASEAGPDLSTSSGRRTFEIESSARLPNGIYFVRRAVVELNSNIQQKYDVLAWGRGGSLNNGPISSLPQSCFDIGASD